MVEKILNAVLHEVGKKSGSLSVTFNKDRATLLSLEDPILKKFTASVIKAYRTEVNTFGDLKPIQTNEFHKSLSEWRTEDTNFLDFSKSSTKLIVEQLKKPMSNKATGGYILFLEYESRKEHYLMIVMLKMESSYGINKTSLEFSEYQTFDMKYFHESARINLTTLSDTGENKKCLSFVKKRNSEQDITRYLINALGCFNYAESNTNTNYLIEALKDYSKHKELTDAQTQTKLETLGSYLQDRLKDKTAVSLVAITGILSETSSQEDLENEDDETSENDFLDFIRENDEKYPISDTFKPHPGKTKSLLWVRGKVGKSTLNVPVSEIQKSVRYNESNNQVTFFDAADFIAQLKKAESV
ncbi:nucleoid-associated protein [Acinetobacter guillouiae]|uniref:nucleoid-associated protein n=1 Tax=Acinetobacter guillouiae TaxID=106649 RepID=UPI001AE54460|nr:nucleoid-associated protein [Acinetobacter guillouiae]